MTEPLPRTPEEAMDRWAALSDAERLAAHQDDSYGNCVICKEYVPHTDDESFAVAFPCAVVRLAALSEAVPEERRETAARAGECRHCPVLSHTTEWHEAHYSYPRRAAAPLTDAPSELDAATLTIAREDIEQAVQQARIPGDWACAECHPQSNILIDGFQCWYHRLAARLGDRP